MTIADTKTTPAFTPVLFVATVFSSAALVFMVEPMMAKLVLPVLGGSAAVWNTSLAFFQAALLAGYIYAHLLQRLGSIRLQIVLHLAVVVAAALVLPLKVSGLLGDPDPNQPALWLVGTLAISIGAPFAALSATAPLIQAWHARTVRHEGGGEPYALYAASNLGSLLALIAYPVLIEPSLSLRHQTLYWSLAYGVFLLIITVLAATLWRRAPARVFAASHGAEAGAVVTWVDRARWIVLAAIPSSLMLGVTTYITTDVGSAPFLWVAPLALYLTTFIVAFQTRPAISRKMALLLQAVAVVLCCSFIHFLTGGFVQEVAIHLGAFFLTALICHQALVDRRPAPEHLTEFYICMSVGGVVGGGFNAFLAPLIFNTVIEYPALLVISCLARPWGSGPVKPWQWLFAGLALLIGGAAVLLVHPGPAVAASVDHLLGPRDPTRVAAPLLGLVAILAFMLRSRAWLFMAVILVLTFSANRVGDRVDVRHTWRGFFGVLRESRMHVPGLGGETHMLAHGTTMHGAQALDSRYRCQPLVYYAHETPIGQVFDAKRAAKPAIDVGAVGLGTGSVAAYSRAGDSLTFFEIDPLVVRVSTNPANFSYTSQCAKGHVGFVLGDARLTLNRQPNGRFDVLLIDAFSSDSVPAHLLTVEALKMYLAKLKPDGVVILHLSNQNLDLVNPAQALVAAAGAHGLYQAHMMDESLPDLWEASEDAVIVANNEAALSPFKADKRWEALDARGVRPWTDDYTNLFGALVRRTKERWGW